MLIDVFLQGGWMMWPILAASVVALAVVVNRLVHLARTQGPASALRDEVVRLAVGGKVEEARALCARSAVPAAAVLDAGLSAWGLAQEEVERRMEQAAVDQLERAEARLPLLATMIAVLPMMGFLGTIFGLIDAFSTWSRAGAEVSIAELAGGISQAMITTGAGLITSIPYVVAYNAFSNRAARVARQLNAAGSELAGAHRLRRAAPAEAPAPERAPEGEAA